MFSLSCCFLTVFKTVESYVRNSNILIYMYSYIIYSWFYAVSVSTNFNFDVSCSCSCPRSHPSFRSPSWSWCNLDLRTFAQKLNSIGFNEKSVFLFTLDNIPHPPNKDNTLLVLNSF